MAVVSFAPDLVIDALVTNLRAATGFRAPSEAGTDVPVFDGGYPSGGKNSQLVVIGSDGERGGVQRPFRFTSDWHDLDMTTDETGTVQCAVVVWGGEAKPTTFASQRATAVEILQNVDEALRASVSAASLGVAQLLWSKVDAGEMVQGVTDYGTETRLTFTYGYRALLQVT